MKKSIFLFALRRFFISLTWCISTSWLVRHIIHDWWIADLVNLAAQDLLISANGGVGACLNLFMGLRLMSVGAQRLTSLIFPLLSNTFAVKFSPKRLKTPLNVLILNFLARVRPQDSFISQIILPMAGVLLQKL